MPSLQDSEVDTEAGQTINRLEEVGLSYQFQFRAMGDFVNR